MYKLGSKPLMFPRSPFLGHLRSFFLTLILRRLHSAIRRTLLRNIYVLDLLSHKLIYHVRAVHAPILSSIVRRIVLHVSKPTLQAILTTKGGIGTLPLGATVTCSQSTSFLPSTSSRDSLLSPFHAMSEKSTPSEPSVHFSCLRIVVLNEDPDAK